MTNKDLINKVIKTVKNAKLENSEVKLSKIESSLEHPTKRISFIGEFKTGKSTLLNMILGENIIFTDEDEATAIPTEVCYGQNKRLEVYPYRKKTVTIDGIEQVVYDDVDTPLIIENPTKEDIKKYTAGDSKEEKVHIAKTTAYARLYYPNSILKDLVFIDTPGINSNTDAVTATVFRALPTSDLIVFVKQAKQFSESELSFLKQHVFDKKSSRGLILINDDPRFIRLNDESRKNLEKDIVAELAILGHTHIPVEFCNLNALGATSDMSDENNPLRINNTFVQNFVSFVSANVVSGYEIRQRELIADGIKDAIEECNIRLSALNISEEELKARQERKAEMSEKIDAVFSKSLEKVLSQLKIAKDSYCNSMFKRISEVVSEYESNLEACDDISSIQSVIYDIGKAMPNDIIEINAINYNDFSQKCKAILTEANVEISDSLSSVMNLSLNDIENNDIGKVIVSIPTVVFYILDAAIALYFGPLGIFGDILCRFVSQYIPYIKEIMPIQLMKRGIKHYVKNGLENYRKALSAKFEEVLSEKFNEVLDEITNSFISAAELKKQNYNSAIDSALDENSDKYKNILEQCKIELVSYLKEIY